MLLTYTKPVNNVIGIFFLNPKIDFGFKDFTPNKFITQNFKSQGRFLFSLPC